MKSHGKRVAAFIEECGGVIEGVRENGHYLIRWRYGGHKFLLSMSGSPSCQYGETNARRDVVRSLKSIGVRV